MVAGVHSIYRLADVGDPVARARRVKRRPREQSAEVEFPGGDAGASVRATVWQTAVNPPGQGALSAAPGTGRREEFPGGDAGASVRATVWQTAVNP